MSTNHLRRPRPVPAYKARLAQRRERLAEKAYWQSCAEGYRHLFAFLAEQSRRTDVAVTQRRAAGLLKQLFTAATETTTRLAQDFVPKKGPGDARFFG